MITLSVRDIHQAYATPNNLKRHSLSFGDIR